MNYFLNESAYDTQRIKAGKRAYEYLLNCNKVQAEIPSHFTYTTESSLFRKEGYKKRESLDLDAGRIGIQAEAPEGVICQFIPEWATLGIDEAQTWFSSRDGGTQGYQFSFF